jgi:hypothetical protein
MFQNLGLFPSPGEGSETPTVLGPSEGANLHHWTGSSFRNVVSSSHLEHQVMDEGQKPAILSYATLITLQNLLTSHDTTSFSPDQCIFICLM